MTLDFIQTILGGNGETLFMSFRLVGDAGSTIQGAGADLPGLDNSLGSVSSLIVNLFIISAVAAKHSGSVAISFLGRLGVWKMMARLLA
jgi:hypothetical protein